MKYIISVKNDRIEITVKDIIITKVTFTDELPPAEGYNFQSGGIRELYILAEKQFKEYFMGARKEFNLPVLQSGTPFEKNIWSNIGKIGYGETISYSKLAELSDAKGAERAVGQAVAKNHLLLVVPCHRIIRKSGDPGEYSAGKQRKLKLLQLEKKNKTNILNP